MALKPNARRFWPKARSLADDPAGRAGTTDAEMLEFNKRLYAPSDTWKQPSAAIPPVYEGTTPISLAGGYQTGNAGDILSRYRTPGTFASVNGAYIAPTIGGSPTPPQLSTPRAAVGVAGPTGSAGSPALNEQDQDNYSSAWDPSKGAPVAGPQNAIQRHQAEAAQRTQPQQQEGGMREISPQRRYFWSTGRIDARPTDSPRNARTDFDATFGPDAAGMPNRPSTTWQERQFSNQAKQNRIVADRGLPDNWSAY